MALNRGQGLVGLARIDHADGQAEADTEEYDGHNVVPAQSLEDIGRDDLQQEAEDAAFGLGLRWRGGDQGSDALLGLRPEVAARLQQQRAAHSDHTGEDQPDHVEQGHVLEDGPGVDVA
jgi:hypothetical protein